MSKREVQHSAARGVLSVAYPCAGVGIRLYLDARSRAVACWHDRRVLRNAFVWAVVIVAHALALAPLLIGEADTALNDHRLGATSVIHGDILEVAAAHPFVRKPHLSAPVLRTISFTARSHERTHLLRMTSADPLAGQSGLAVLYGRYLGQIQARIERAWLRPRTAIGSPLFQCQVRIAQNHDGEVGDVTLQRCNGTLKWQESLVSAVDEASPLSAPPNPAVFTSHVVLVFRSMGYTQGAPSGQFAPAPAPKVIHAQATADALTKIRALGQAKTALFGRDAVIELDINGSHVHVVTKH